MIEPAEKSRAERRICHGRKQRKSTSTVHISKNGGGRGDLWNMDLARRPSEPIGKAERCSRRAREETVKFELILARAEPQQEILRPSLEKPIRKKSDGTRSFAQSGGANGIYGSKKRTPKSEDTKQRNPIRIEREKEARHRPVDKVSGGCKLNIDYNRLQKRSPEFALQPIEWLQARGRESS